MKATERKVLLTTLQERFEKHPKRHKGIPWSDVLSRIESSPQSLKALQAMESTGGAPDVVAFDHADGRFTFCDCSPESPDGRRSLCYDAAALTARKENKPEGSAMAMAAAMGIELLDETAYRHLQTLGEFDLKTSSWISTPVSVRALGGALFCDRRYDQVFVYHNGVQSYYAARGFRGMIRI